jgi:hypothetical protein
MDFKSIISKLDSMEARPQTPAAPQLDKAVQLNEDAQLRVLSGRSTYVSEAKKKAEEDVKEEMKVGDKKASSTGGTIEKTATGIKHTAGKNYSGKAAEKEEKSKKDESIEPVFKSKFMKMVEAAKEESESEKAEAKEKLKKKKEKMAKIMDEGSLPMVKKNGKMVPTFAADGKGKNDLGDEDDSDEGNDDSGKKPAGKKGMSAAQAKYFGKKESVKETAEMKTGDKKASSTGGTIEKTKTGLKHTAGKNYSGKAAEADKKKTDESKMMPKGKKRPVKESVENILSFKDMIKLVQESGGQQQIDAVDQELFAWAQRVARQKIGEGIKADVYAGMVYERMGGVFEMYDVLSEDQK